MSTAAFCTRLLARAARTVCYAPPSALMAAGPAVTARRCKASSTGDGDGGKGSRAAAAAARRERSRAISHFYQQSEIERKAELKTNHLTLESILFTKKDLLKSADYLWKEIPVRLAHRIAELRSLPFIAGCNPTFLEIHELYIKSFTDFDNFPVIKTEDDVDRFAELIRVFLDEHKDIISLLAQASKEVRKYMDKDLLRSYLDKNLTSRLCLRLLCTHQLCLEEDSRPGYTGIINTNMNLKDLIRQKYDFVETVAGDRYGCCPPVVIEGDTSAAFPYFELPLDYMLPELLKNAARATVEKDDEGGLVDPDSLPPVRVFIKCDEEFFTIRITDEGSGIPHDEVDKVMEYHYSTAEKSTQKLMDKDVMASMMEVANRTHGPMHGFGVGLSVCRAYAERLNGSLKINSVEGLGTTVHLTLSRSFRV